MHYPTLTMRITSEKIPRKGNVTKYVENLKVKIKQEKCGKLWHPRRLGVNTMLYSGTRENA